jgi:hypothetical protein
LTAARTQHRRRHRSDFPQKDNHFGCSQQKRMSSMCDYSLHDVASRPAKVGDRLVTTKFRHSITGGFAALGEPEVAVCLRPGTELAFDHDIAYGHSFGLLPPRLGYETIQQRVARFRHVDPHRPNVHHDALEFPNGEVVMLTLLREGMRATVLQLPADPDRKTVNEPSQSAESETASFTG